MFNNYQIFSKMALIFREVSEKRLSHFFANGYNAYIKFKGRSVH